MNEPFTNKSVRGTDGAENPLIPFEPVPLRPRRDGWTVEKQYAFIEALAETGIVEEACRRVGMSRTSVDNLRRRAEACTSAAHGKRHSITPSTGSRRTPSPVRAAASRG